MKKVQIFILILAILVLIGSSGYLGKYFIERHISAKNMEDVKNMILPEANVTPNPATESDPAPETTSNGILEKYSKLYETNPDFAGWISIPGTTIDYPVMYKAADNETYLHANFNGEYDAAGTPFIDGYCTMNPPCDNLIIYGHNMNDKSMFQPLLNYKDREFYESHKTIQFDTRYETGTYEVIAVNITRVLGKNESGFRYYQNTNFFNEEDFNTYMDNLFAGSLYERDPSITYGDQFITLSTCEYTYENGRLIVVAKKVK